MAIVDRGFFVIRMDNRDAGLSSITADRDEYTLSNMADDVVAVLDDVGVDTAVVLGLSLGGMIAQQLAVDHPERVRALVSVASTTGEPDLPVASDEVVAALTASNPPKVLHIACVRPVSVAELAALVADIAGRDKPTLDAARKAPLLTVDVGGPLCVNAALSALDWRPTPLADAIRETVAWYETAEHRSYTRALADGRTPAALAEPEPQPKRRRVT